MKYRPGQKRYTVVEGSYRDTNDNCLGRWYIKDSQAATFDKSGPGLTRQKAIVLAAELNAQGVAPYPVTKESNHKSELSGCINSAVKHV